jgi:hypothetical protein
MFFSGRLDGLDDLRDGVLGLDPLSIAKERVHTGETDEGDSCGAVLALGRRRRDMRADAGRDEGLDVQPLDRRERLERAARRRLRAQKASFALRLAEHLGVEQRRGFGAQEDLAGLGGRLHLDGARRRRACDDQLAVRRADEEEVEPAAVDADVHAQLDRSRRGFEPPDLAEAAAHAECGARSARCVVGARIEEEERIASELEQATPVAVRDLEELGEGRVHHLRDLLGAGLALRGQLLGHRREAGDVHEGHRPFQEARTGGWIVERPLDDHPRDVRGQLGARHSSIVQILTRFEKKVITL